MLTRNGSPLTWTVDNLPVSLGASQGSSTFSYGPDHDRYSQAATDNGVSTDTTYIGGLFEVVATATTTHYRHNIIADGQVIAVHTIDQSGNATTSYLHYDHLGSVDTITNDQGTIAQQMSFDAFGLRRDASNWDYDLTTAQITALKDDTDRGYTFQEQLDNLSLVDLNGRVYDPTVGRFLSSDPVEGGNRYAYVYNNPMRFTDPSGYCTFCLSTFTNPVTILTGIPMPANTAQNVISQVGQALAHPSIMFEDTSPIVGHYVNSLMARSGTMQEVGAGAAMVVSYWFGPEVYAGYEAYITDVSGGTPIQDLEAGAAGYGEAYAFDNFAHGLVNVYDAPFASEGDALLNAGQYAYSQVEKMYLNAVVVNELNRVAARNGMNVGELDAALLAASFLGNATVGSRLCNGCVINGQVDIEGIDNRGILGLPFDFVDVLLEYQGIPSASGWQYIFGNYQGMPLVGHSAGALTVNNIAFWGAAQGPVSAYALPFFNGGSFGVSVNNKAGDIVPGSVFGWAIDPWANFVPGWGHSACGYGISNWPGC